MAMVATSGLGDRLVENSRCFRRQRLLYCNQICSHLNKHTTRTRKSSLLCFSFILEETFAYRVSWTDQDIKLEENNAERIDTKDGFLQKNKSDQQKGENGSFFFSSVYVYLFLSYCGFAVYLLLCERRKSLVKKKERSDHLLHKNFAELFNVYLFEFIGRQML